MNRLTKCALRTFLLAFAWLACAMNAMAGTVESDAVSDRLAERFIDPAYWASEAYQSLDMSGKAIPGDADIPQAQALKTALRALLDLKWETPETIERFTNITFSFAQHTEGRDWSMTFESPKEGGEPPYLIKINAATGTIRYLLVLNPAKVSFPEKAQTPELNDIVKKWENAQPLGKRDASDSRSTPGSDDLPLSQALHIAFHAVRSIKGLPVEALDGYTPNIEFHAYPNYGRFWEITLASDAYQEGNTPLMVRISSPDRVITEISDPSKG